jgi:DNA-binding transcriptional ArsR family regulator
MEDKTLILILDFLKKSKDGMTITDLVNCSGLSRSSIRTALAKLEGARKIIFRQVGMAKLYSVSGRKK